MARFAVIRVHGPAWDWSKPLREQDAWEPHAAFMSALKDEGFVVLAGPLGENTGRVLLIIDAATEADIEARLAQDPWVPMGLLELSSVERWNVLLSPP
jgi:uncharacterized protein YciI